MLLLALDTATPAVTVALHDGRQVLAEVTSVDARRHGELLAPGIDQVLRTVGATATDLTAVVVGTGPGPFTGLRVGLVTARTLTMALDLPGYGVCSLDAVAQHAVGSGAVTADELLVATDARRREVYWALYRHAGGLVERVAGPQVAAASAVPVRGRPVVGRGADLYADQLGGSQGAPDPSAGVLATVAVRSLATGQDLTDISPRYLRRPDVHEGGGRKSVRS